MLCALHGSQGIRVITFNTRKAAERFTASQEVVDCCSGLDDNNIIGSLQWAWDIVNGIVIFTILCFSNDSSFYWRKLATTLSFTAMSGSRESTSKTIHCFQKAPLYVSSVGNILLQGLTANLHSCRSRL
jgi:hypothetical protein